jgi:hypothetical protein
MQENKSNPPEPRAIRALGEQYDTYWLDWRKAYLIKHPPIGIQTGIAAASSDSPTTPENQD